MSRKAKDPLYRDWTVDEGQMGPKGDITVSISAGNRFICGVEGHSEKEFQDRGWFSPEECEAIANVIAVSPQALRFVLAYLAWHYKGISPAAGCHNAPPPQNALADMARTIVERVGKYLPVVNGEDQG
jgi:hypothetical protein